MLRRCGALRFRSRLLRLGPGRRGASYRVVGMLRVGPRHEQSDNGYQAPTHDERSKFNRAGSYTSYDS